MPDSDNSGITLFDRFAVFIGAGLLGVVSGFVLGAIMFLLSYLMPIFDAVIVAKICLLYLPGCVGLFTASLGAFCPDLAADFLAELWNMSVATLQNTFSPDD